MDLKPPTFKVTSNHAANTWQKFKQNFEIYVNATGLEDNEKRK